MSKDDKVMEIAKQLSFLIASKMVDDIKEQINNMPDEVIDDLYNTRPFDNDNKKESAKSADGNIIELLKQRQGINLN